MVYTPPLSSECVIKSVPTDINNRKQYSTAAFRHIRETVYFAYIVEIKCKAKLTDVTSCRENPKAGRGLIRCICWLCLYPGWQLPCINLMYGQGRGRRPTHSAVPLISSNEALSCRVVLMLCLAHAGNHSDRYWTRPSRVKFDCRLIWSLFSTYLNNFDELTLSNGEIMLPLSWVFYPLLKRPLNTSTWACTEKICTTGTGVVVV